LAAVLRRLPRPDRAAVLTAIERVEPQNVERLRREMFSFNDLLTVEDRPLQGLLAAIDLKTLALALKGADNAIAEKVLRNTSSRTRQALSDEISLLANVSKTTINDAQARVAELLRMQEEEGKISFDA
jgi:flagellar motor switch protein FliG